FGRFIACSNFPKCRYSRNLEDKTKEKPEMTDRICPKCGANLLKRKSRFGTYFYGCSRYPECHYMENEAGEEIISKRDRYKKAAAAAEETAETSAKPAAKKTMAKKAAAKKTTTKKTTT
ncbi:MAG TPA: DNA topoisomerase I, partial [Erysipelotrichaceae bacterium]|nr:DNA topoisomerase I [Erysipelotrichaceae bacterium]